MKLPSEFIRVRCPSCAREEQKFVPENAPQVAKVQCVFCDYVYEVKTRDTAYEPIREHVEEGKDRNRVAKRHTISGSSAGRRPQMTDAQKALLRELGAVSTKMAGDVVPTVQTPLGKAYLIG